MPNKGRWYDDCVLIVCVVSYTLVFVRCACLAYCRPITPSSGPYGGGVELAFFLVICFSITNREYVDVGCSVNAIVHVLTIFM